MRLRSWCAPLAGLCLLSAQPARASDGVLEINQAKVLASGGFPFTISQSGNYRLTSDLDLRILAYPASANTSAINIGNLPPPASVSIDLNGFSILGPCSAFGICVELGIGAGINAQSGNPAVSIRNGKVIGAGRNGVDISVGFAKLEDLVVMHNGGIGVYIARGVVSQTVATHNGSNGIAAFDAVIKDCYVSNNGLARTVFQIDIAHGTIDDCAVDAGNRGVGIEIGDGVLRGTSVNAGVALECSSACALTANKFTGCDGPFCITGGGPVMEVPAASNMCGSEDCIP